MAGAAWLTGHRRLGVTQKSPCAVRPRPPGLLLPTWGAALVLPHPEEPQVRPTSFRGGELLGFTARPIASPIDHDHLQLVVTVGEEAGHHATGAVTREAGLLPLLRHPQALQQAALPPVVGLRDRGGPVRGRSGGAGLVVSAGGSDRSSLRLPQAPSSECPQQPCLGLGERPVRPHSLAPSAYELTSNRKRGSGVQSFSEPQDLSGKQASWPKLLMEWTVISIITLISKLGNKLLMEAMPEPQIWAKVPAWGALFWAQRPRRVELD